MDQEISTKTVQVRTQEKFAELANRYVESYTLVSIVIPWANRQTLKKRTERVCRFCGKNSTETTFRMDAHLLPHFLGNNSFLSDFECDTCNTTFSGYENHFANLVGAERTLNQIKGKRGIPKFKAPSAALKITVEDFYNKESIQITRPSTDNSTFGYDKETGTIHVSFRKNSYIPNAAYKCLLKIALSVIPEDEINKYTRLKRYLFEPTYGKLEGCFVIKYSLPFGTLFQPHVLLFRKVNPDEETMTHMISLCCLNYIFWVPVMLHDDDMSFYEKKSQIKIPPPLFVQKGELEQYNIGRTLENWSSTELKKNDTQAFRFNFDMPNWEQGIAIDPKTGEKTKHVFDEKEVISLIIVKNDGTPIDFTKSTETMNDLIVVESAERIRNSGYYYLCHHSKTTSQTMQKG